MQKYTWGGHSCVYIHTPPPPNGNEAINNFCFICKLCLQLSQQFQEKKITPPNIWAKIQLFFFADPELSGKSRNQH